MAADATKGYGAVLYYGDSSTVAGSTTWTAVAQVRDITLPTVEADDIDVTNQDSTGGAREYIPGLIEGGECEFELLFKKSAVTAVYALLATQKGWRVTVNDHATADSKWEFDGYVKSFGGEIPLEDPVMCSVTIKVTGKPAFTASA